MQGSNVRRCLLSLAIASAAFSASAADSVLNSALQRDLGVMPAQWSQYQKTERIAEQQSAAAQRR